MHVLFEEEGAFKAATIVTDNETSLQVETASGKRSKIKSANVLLRYSEPAATGLLDQAEALAADIEPEFLWECVGDGEGSVSVTASFLFLILPTSTSVTSPRRLKPLRSFWPCMRRRSIFIARAKVVSARHRPRFSRPPLPASKGNASKP